MSMMKGTIELTKYYGASIEERIINGEMVDCISIPIDINGLTRRSNGKVFLGFICFDRKPNPYMATHSITPRMLKTKKERLEKMGFYKDMRYIGQILNYNNNAWINRETGDSNSRVPLEIAMKID